MTATTHVRLRTMYQQDRPQIVAIERHSYKYDWDEREFRVHSTMPNCANIVCSAPDQNGLVLGYMVYLMLPHLVQVLKLAVHKDVLRQGIGSFMLDRVISDIAKTNTTRINIEVEESNLGACLFLKAMRFRCVNVLRNWFASCDSDEDAYLFQRRLQK